MAFVWANAFAGERHCKRARHDDEGVSFPCPASCGTELDAIVGEKNVMMESLFAFTAFTVLFTASAAFAGPHGRETPDRTGILIASFGTSMPGARKAIDNLVDSAKKAFPDAEV